MRTLAIVKTIYENGDAEISVERRAACEGCHRAAGDKECSVCTLLGGKREATARATNAPHALVGDTVLVESGTRRMLFYAALIFLLPVLLLLAGYFVGRALFGDKGAFCAAAVGFFLPFLPIGMYSRRRGRQKPDIAIVEIVKKAD